MPNPNRGSQSSASAAAAAVDQQQPSSGEESSETGQTIVVHSIHVPVPTFHRDLSASDKPGDEGTISDRSASPSFFPPKPDKTGLRRSRSMSAPKRRPSIDNRKPSPQEGGRSSHRVATKSSSYSDSERSGILRTSMRSSSSPSPPSRPARGDRPRRRASCDSNSIASVTSRNSLRFDIVDSDADEEDDELWDSADDDDLTNMEVISRVHLNSAGEALKGDLPRHWDAGVVGVAAAQRGGRGLDVSTTSGDVEVGRRPSIMSTLPVGDPLGESEQAYMALMSLMRNQYENNGEGDDNGTAATRASRKSSRGSGGGGLVSVGFEGSGDGSGRLQKRRGSNKTDNSAKSHRSGFWSAIGTLAGNHSDDESYSHDGSESSSAYTKSSPMTREKSKRRRLNVRHCARAMVVFVALSALSGSLVYFLWDNPFALVSSLFGGGGDGGSGEDEEVRKLPLTGDIDMEPRDRAHSPALRRVELVYDGWEFSLNPVSGRARGV